MKGAKHIFTHIEWHMVGYYIEAEIIGNRSEFVWVTEEERQEGYSIPSAFKEYLLEKNNIL